MTGSSMAGRRADGGEASSGRPVVREALNDIHAQHVTERGQSAGTPGRIALAVAGDGAAANAVVIGLLDELRFEGVDGGGPDEYWGQQPGTPVYAVETMPRVCGRPGPASPERRPESRHREQPWPLRVSGLRRLAVSDERYPHLSGSRCTGGSSQGSRGSSSSGAETNAKPNTVQRSITTVSGKVFFKGGMFRCSDRFFFHFDIFRLITLGLIRLRRGSVRSTCISQSKPRYHASKVAGVVPHIPATGISKSESTP